MTKRHGKMIQKMSDISSKTTKNEEGNGIVEKNLEQKVDDSELNEVEHRELIENLVSYLLSYCLKFYLAS